MKVAIDPGHGMSNRKLGVYDPGALHSEGAFGFEEAAIALRYAIALRDAFRSRGSAVFLTREDPGDHAPIAERAGNARLAGADALVSLHLNSAEDDRASGVEVLYRSAASRPLAEAIQHALVALTKFRDRGAKPRNDLAVLRFPGPAVLIELGFLGNDGDRAVLLNPARRHAICDAVAETALAQLGPSSPQEAARAPGADRRRAPRRAAVRPRSR